MKLFIKKINNYIEEQFFERTQVFNSGKAGHITKYRFKIAIEKPTGRSPEQDQNISRGR